MRWVIPALLATTVPAADFPPPNPPSESQALREFVGQHGKPPIDYVVDTFKTHDIVFLGEHHYIKHDVTFVQRLIRETYYARGRDALAIEDFCDGYIFLMPLCRSDMVTIDEQFITESNLDEAIAQLPDPEDRARCKSVSDVLTLIRQQAVSGLEATKAGAR